MLSLLWAAPLLADGSGPNPQAHRITDEEALQSAMEQAKLGPGFKPQPAQLAFDSQGRAWYLVDFLRSDETSDKTVLGKRLILDPQNGSIVTEEETLKEMNALISFEEAMRKAMDFIGEGKNNRFDQGQFYYDAPTQGYWYHATFTRADNESANQARRAKEVYTSMGYDSARRLWYAVNFFNVEAKDQKELWEKRVLVNPMTGKIDADELALKDLLARQGDIPPGVNPKTREYQATPLAQPAKRIVVFGILALLLGAAFYWRKAIARVRKFDLLFGTAALIQLILALYFARTDTFAFIFLLTSTISTVTFWASTKSTRS